tara:strand:- start:5188 stop:5868 length:681 start_codon:yes stop_codon:yes gene_type:complete
MAEMQLSLFERLKKSASAEWLAYMQHAFVQQLATGVLPESAFRHYLAQDYLFLIHFARAYALGVYKATTLEDMRHSSAAMSAILDTEMALHVKFCEGWGLSPKDLESTEEASATMAYTRFVLETGLAGDALDLHTALSPCVIGYAEIARNIIADPQTRLEDNPYRPWIEEYASDAYQNVAQDARDYLDRLGDERLTEIRYPKLVEVFGRATRLEADFWEMGLNCAS